MKKVLSVFVFMIVMTSNDCWMHSLDPPRKLILLFQALRTAK